LAVHTGKREGELEAIKVGRSVRVSRTSYIEWTRRRRYMDVVAGE
jgi:hypothetical protein